MPLRYTVHARVIDIRSDSPRATDRFLVDTNVWAWEFHFQHAITAGGMRIPRVAEYHLFLIETRHANAIRYRTTSQLAELAHLIEQNELDAYSAAVGPLAAKD